MAVVGCVSFARVNRCWSEVQHPVASSEGKGDEFDMEGVREQIEEVSDELSSLDIRHRKERKELQAEIQALKKAAKNDKTKKKELTAAIARLEFELENRQKVELEAIQTISTPNVAEGDTIETIEKDAPKIKISKAQKRRDKKSHQEKEREEQIKLQEKENINGPRNQEMEAINAKLKKKHLKIFSIPSDGDCLYKAVAHQLHLLWQKVIGVDELRNNVSTYMKQHIDDFLPFMSNPDTCDILTEEEFYEYCDKVNCTKVWGGQLEIRALSNVLKCPIHVIQATGPDSIEQGTEFEGPPLIITYHRHMYSLGEHYNSTSIAKEVEESS